MRPGESLKPWLSTKEAGLPARPRQRHSGCRPRTHGGARTRPHRPQLRPHAAVTDQPRCPGHRVRSAWIRTLTNPCQMHTTTRTSDNARVGLPAHTIANRGVPLHRNSGHDVILLCMNNGRSSTCANARTERRQRAAHGDHGRRTTADVLRRRTMHTRTDGWCTRSKAGLPTRSRSVIAIAKNISAGRPITRVHAPTALRYK